MDHFGSQVASYCLAKFSVSLTLTKPSSLRVFVVLAPLSTHALMSD